MIRLRTLFFATSVAILLVPLGGVALLRVYQSVLVRRTEQDLLVQGAWVAALYRRELQAQLDAPHGGASAAERAAYGNPITDRVPARADRFAPLEARLDLARDGVLSAPPPAAPPEAPPDAWASRAGAAVAPLLVEAQARTLAGVRVVDPRGTVVATSGAEGDLSLLPRDEVRRALAGETVSLLRERVSESPQPEPPLPSLSRRSRMRCWVALPVEADDRIWGAVLLSRTPAAVSQSLWGIRYWLLGWGAALLVVAAAVAGLTSRLVARPLEDLVRQAERVARGERGAASGSARPTTVEVATLADAFGRTARELQAREGYLRAFVSSVSHELKTPLTSLRGTTELLRDHLGEMDEAQRARFLSNLAADVDRLERLVVGLVELARADVIRPGGQTTPAADALAHAAARAHELGLPADVDVQPGTPAAVVSPEALATVMSQLVENAHRHGGPGVRLWLAAAPAADDGRAMVRFEVTDDGPGISEGNLPRVFEPFFTTARAAGGTGLGLCLARTLLLVHGGAIDVLSTPGRTTFRVRVPAEARGPSGQGSPAPGGPPGRGR